MAIIVLKDTEYLSEEEVINHCRTELAHFKAPKRVIFVDSLPKNPSGKLLKRNLRTRYTHVIEKEATKKIFKREPRECSCLKR